MQKKISLPLRCSLILLIFVCGMDQMVAQDSCPNAVNMVVVSEAQCGTNSVDVTQQYSTSNVTPLGCGAIQQTDWWGKFTATSVLTAVNLYGGSGMNVGSRTARILVYKGPCSSTMNLIKCTGEDNNYWDDFLQVPTTPGTTYYVRVMATDPYGVTGKMCVWADTVTTTPYPFCDKDASFESGTPSGWTCRSGYYDTLNGFVLPNIGVVNVNGINAPIDGPGDRHTICDATGRDPNSFNKVPFVAPGGGKYSFRLGNDNTTSSMDKYPLAESVSLDLNVTSSNAGFTYMYAAFLEDGGHAPKYQPRFEVLVTKKSDGSLINCGYYKVEAGSGNANFFPGYDYNSCYYTNWTQVGLDLTAYIGQTVAIEFRTADCYGDMMMCNSNGCSTFHPPGGHSAYAYIDAYCIPLTVATPEFCAGTSSIQICAPAGYLSYSWPAGQPGLSGSPTTQCVTINNPIPGTTYTVNMGGVSGCPASTTVKLQSIPIVKTNDTTICPGTTVNIAAPVINGKEPPYTYNWSHNLGTTPTVSVSPASTTTYTVTVTNGKGCTASEKIVVTVNCGPAVNISPITVCSGTCGAISATGIGGTAPYTYSWSPGGLTGSSVSVCPASTSTYTVIATDNGGTTASNIAIVTVTPLPTVGIAGTTSICAGQSTTLSASGGGGTTYLWNTGASTTSITVSPTNNSNYTVTATNAGGCTGTATIAVTVNPNPVPTISGTTTICAGTSTTLTASGGGTYNWSTGSTIAAITVSPPSGTTTYTVTVTNNGCTASATAAVTVAANLIPVITGNTTVCNGSSTTLSTSGGGTYAWSDGSSGSSITVSPLVNTSYSVTVTNGSCSGTATVQVTVNAMPIPNITGTTIICSGQSTTLTANAGGSYQWDQGQTTSTISVSPTITTNYTVTVTTAGCTGIATAQVVVNPTPAPIISGPASICSGQSAILTSSTTGPYNWSTGESSNAITVTPSGTTSYSVSVTVNGCTGTAAQTVTVVPQVIAKVTGNSICAGNNATLSANGGTSYLWNTGATTNSITVSPASTTMYTVRVAVGSCADTATYTVTVHPLPTAIVSSDTTITYGNSATLKASGGGTYNWIPPTGLSCTGCASPIASPTTTTQYCVIIKDTIGCSDSACVTVHVDLKCGFDEGGLFIPNGFSPNSDGQNDVLYVRGPGIATMHWSIYDRWGERVFETTDPKQGWDGTYKGKQLEPAVFVYYLKATCITGNEMELKGNVALIK